MSPNSPAVGPTFCLQVIMAHQLRIHVVNLKAGMMRVAFLDGSRRALDEEALIACQWDAYQPRYVTIQLTWWSVNSSPLSMCMKVITSLFESWSNRKSVFAKLKCVRYQSTVSSNLDLSTTTPKCPSLWTLLGPVSNL